MGVHDGDDMFQPDATRGATIMHIPSRVFGDVRFRASVTLLVLDPDADSNELYLISGSEVVGDVPATGYACGIARFDPGAPDVRIKNLVDEVAEIGTFVGSPEGTFTFELDNRPTGVTCSVLGPGAGQVDQLQPIDMSTGEVAVFSDDVSARVQWIEVISNLCPP